MRAFALGLLLLALAVPAHGGDGEDGFFDMTFPDLITAPADARLHPHVCVVGTVGKVRVEKDGDVHIPLEGMPGRPLVLEVIPEIPLPTPPRGHRIRACGIVRYDGWHKWWELHPLLLWAPR